MVLRTTALVNQNWAYNMHFLSACNGQILSEPSVHRVCTLRRRFIRITPATLSISCLRRRQTDPACIVHAGNEIPRETEVTKINSTFLEEVHQSFT